MPELASPPEQSTIAEKAVRSYSCWPPPLGDVWNGFSATLGLHLICGAHISSPLIIDVLAGLSLVLGVILNGAILAVAILSAAVTLNVSKPRNIKGECDLSFDVAFLSIASIMTVISFGQLCRYLQQLAGGFTASRGSYWYWVGFGLDEFLNAVLLDAPSIYRWRVSDVQAVSLWARSLQFVFHLCLITVVVAAAWRHAKITRDTWRAPRLTSSSPSGRAWVFILKLASLSVFWCFTVGIVGIGYLQEMVPSTSPWDAAAHLALFSGGATLAIGSAALWFAGGNFYFLVGTLVSPLNGSARELWRFFWRTLLTSGGLLLGVGIANDGIRWIANVIRSAPL